MHVSVSDATVLDLASGDHMHELDAAQQNPGVTKIFEAEHRPWASLDRPLILLGDIVQIRVLRRSRFPCQNTVRSSVRMALVGTTMPVFDESLLKHWKSIAAGVVLLIACLILHN